MNEGSDDDSKLFRELFSDVKPLQHDKVTDERPKPDAVARFRRADEEQVLSDSLSKDPDDIDFENGDRLSYRRPEINERVLRKLRRGRFTVEEELDLHGLTAKQAQEVLREFLAECRTRQLGCVRIVHGKGLGSGHRGPVLKQKVSRWLRQMDQVLAYVSARQVDGGTGALYVLLRRS